jgi:hypothetical protein
MVWDILIQKVEIEGQKKCPVDLTRQPDEDGDYL